MATIGKNNQSKKTYDIIENNKDNIINQVTNLPIENLTTELFNYFDTDDINSFIEFLHDENVIYIDELDN